MEPIRIAYQSYTSKEQAGSYWKNLKKHLDNIVDEGTTVDIKGISPPDAYAHSLSEFRCAREMISNAIIADREKYDGFAIGHFQDAGLYEARASVDIPVHSLGEASMLYACQLGQKIGIVTINPKYISWFHHQIGKYGLRERVTGVHAMTFEPGSILAAFDQDRGLEKVMTLFAEQAEPLVAGGVDVLIPGGGIPMLLFSGAFNHNVNDAPVINGIPILIKMTEMAVKLKRLTGLTVSRTNDFAKPEEELIEEFMKNPKGL
ncbi:MAG: aspartate/glutamate racemase family protein [Pseudomonadota bacterium]|nr:aspartate/glutamate racemase family protein [Pseudomonadota bacterium]